MKSWATLIVLFVCACTPQSAPRDSELNLVVAASVGPAAQAFAEKIEKSHGLKIRVQAAASSLIARQITGGMPCDVVILADDEWMDNLSSHQAIENATRRHLLGNRLVSIALKMGGKTLADSSRIAIADPEHVPAGKYAKDVFTELGTWESMSPKMVRAPDVRTALLWVERGEVDSGIVYESDALSSSAVEIKAYYEQSRARPILYPIAQCLTKNIRAKDLYDLLIKEPGTQIFRRFGFQVVTGIDGSS